VTRFIQRHFMVVQLFSWSSSIISSIP